ncbi:MAG: Peptidase family M23 [Chloroflexi bacterium ADurb.Bin360]|nr:MAG: Peptidase family M23 [Chloroflexi bacterium ADurb.Bin360]
MALGRFLQADTVIPDPANPQSFNRYSYVLNSPLKYTDPSGHKACLDTDCTQFENTVAFMKESPRSPSPHFTRLPLEPTNESTSQWFGGTNFAHNHGAEWNYDNYCQGFHCGIDIGRQTSEYGTPVYAGLYGIVESTGKSYGAGPYAVNIRVGDYVVIYGHLDGKYNVGVGDAVTPDTIIGGVGNPTGTEGKGNVHLHLEIRYQNRLIYNPLRFIGEPGYKALTTVMNPNDFYYTNKWATPLDQPVIQRGGPSLWKDN